MTKADFLAGKPFKFGYSEYKYNEGPNDIVTIKGGFVFKGKFVVSGYEGDPKKDTHHKAQDTQRGT